MMRLGGWRKHHGLRSLLHSLHDRRHFVVSIEILALGHFGDVTMAISPLE
jgi:hypothetical protein